MSTIVRNVRDIDAVDRVALEHVVGGELRENQQVIIQVVEAKGEGPSASDANRSRIPEWWNVYEGLSDEEIEKSDAAIRQRCNLTREFP